MADRATPVPVRRRHSQICWIRVSYRRVDLKDIDLDPVYRLRYDAYRREEFIPVNSQKVSGDDL